MEGSLMPKTNREGPSNKLMLNRDDDTQNDGQLIKPIDQN